MGGGYYTIIIIMLSCEWVGLVLQTTRCGKFDIYCLMFTVNTPVKAREHCYYLSYYVGCSCVDRNRYYCTEYKKSWRTHSSNKQTFIPKCHIAAANTPPSTMHCHRYVISDLLHSLVTCGGRLWTPRTLHLQGGSEGRHTWLRNVSWGPDARLEPDWTRIP